MQNKRQAVPKETAANKKVQKSADSDQRNTLAKDIAHAFNDQPHLAIYQIYCQNFPVKVVKKAFAQVQAMPSHKVKRSRLALFIYLVKSYAEDKE